MQALRERVAAALSVIAAGSKVVRRVIGVPDYEAYVEHLRCAHPDVHPLTRDEFARQRMEARYSRPGSRCC
jgi:uncharacterized short protein YbdD (DUF466 family)